MTEVYVDVRARCYAAEEAGALDYHHRVITCYTEARASARRIYRSELLRDCYVAGYNLARWGRA